MRTIATAKVQRNHNCYNVYFNECLRNTEPSSIQKTLRNTAGTYTIEIDANIIDHLPQLEEKVLGKNHK